MCSIRSGSGINARKTVCIEVAAVWAPHIKKLHGRLRILYLVLSGGHPFSRDGRGAGHRDNRVGFQVNARPSNQCLLLGDNVDSLAAKIDANQTDA